MLFTIKYVISVYLCFHKKGNIHKWRPAKRGKGLGILWHKSIKVWQKGEGVKKCSNLCDIIYEWSLTCFLSVFLFFGSFFELLSVFYKSFCLFVCLLFSISYKCFGLSMFLCLCYFGTSYECFGLSMFVCLCYFAESNRKSKSNDKRLNQGRSNRRRFFVVVVAQIITFTSDQTKK